MILYIEQHKSRPFFKAISLLVALSFVFTLIVPPVYAQTAVAPLGAGLNLPTPGTMVHLSQPFNPTLMKGVQVFEENPFQFNFIMDRGDSKFEEDELKQEYTKLIKYFLSSLTIPEDDIWVNLSPYEKDRIIPDTFGKTEMGRDLLAQDYLLKQITASLIYPEEELGQNFWDKIYKKAYKQFGTTDIPINTFNKVWIVPDESVVYEKTDKAFVVESRLKVLLEEDYVALRNEMSSAESRVKRGASTYDRGLDEVTKNDAEDLSNISSNIVREIILPELEKEVNTGKHFAPLRQIFHSLILATWYKKALRESILTKIYIDQGKVVGVDTRDKAVNEKIYNQYLEAFKQGVFDFIKEDYDANLDEVLPRKYFSGGVSVPNFQAKVRYRSDPVANGRVRAGLSKTKIDGVAAVIDLPNVTDGRNLFAELEREYEAALDEVAPSRLMEGPLASFVRDTSDLKDKSTTQLTRAHDAIQAAIRATDSGYPMEDNATRLDIYSGSVKLALQAKKNPNEFAMLGENETDAKITFLYQEPVSVLIGDTERILRKITNQNGNIVYELEDKRTGEVRELRRAGGATKDGSRKFTIGKVELNIHFLNDIVSIDRSKSTMATGIKIDQAMQGQLPFNRSQLRFNTFEQWQSNRPKWNPRIAEIKTNTEVRTPGEVLSYFSPTKMPLPLSEYVEKDVELSVRVSEDVEDLTEFARDVLKMAAQTNFGYEIFVKLDKEYRRLDVNIGSEYETFRDISNFGDENRWIGHIHPSVDAVIPERILKRRVAVPDAYLNYLGLIPSPEDIDTYLEKIETLAERYSGMDESLIPFDEHEEIIASKHGFMLFSIDPVKVKEITGRPNVSSAIRAIYKKFKTDAKAEDMQLVMPYELERYGIKSRIVSYLDNEEQIKTLRDFPEMEKVRPYILLASEDQAMEADPTDDFAIQTQLFLSGLESLVGDREDVLVTSPQEMANELDHGNLKRFDVYLDMILPKFKQTVPEFRVGDYTDYELTKLKFTVWDALFLRRMNDLFKGQGDDDWNFERLQEYGYDTLKAESDHIERIQEAQKSGNYLGTLSNSSLTDVRLRILWGMYAEVMNKIAPFNGVTERRDVSREDLKRVDLADLNRAIYAIRQIIGLSDTQFYLNPNQDIEYLDDYIGIMEEVAFERSFDQAMEATDDPEIQTRLFLAAVDSVIGDQLAFIKANPSDLARRTSYDALRRLDNWLTGKIPALKEQDPDLVVGQFNDQDLQRMQHLVWNALHLRKLNDLTGSGRSFSTNPRDLKRAKFSDLKELHTNMERILQSQEDGNYSGGLDRRALGFTRESVVWAMYYRITEDIEAEEEAFRNLEDLDLETLDNAVYAVNKLLDLSPEADGYVDSFGDVFSEDSLRADLARYQDIAALKNFSGQHPVGEKEFTASEITELVADFRKQAGVAEGQELTELTAEQKREWASEDNGKGGISSLLTDALASNSLLVDDAVLPGMKDALETVVALLSGDQTNERAKRINETNDYHIYHVESGTGFQTQAGRKTGAFAVRDSRTGPLNIYISNTYEGMIHEVLEHLVLPSYEQFQPNQYHTVAFFAEAIVIGQKRLAKNFEDFLPEESRVGVDAVVPNRALEQLKSWKNDKMKLNAFVAATDGVIKEIRTQKFSQTDDPTQLAYQKYAQAMALALQSEALKVLMSDESDPIMELAREMVGGVIGAAASSIKDFKRQVRLVKRDGQLTEVNEDDLQQTDQKVGAISESTVANLTLPNMILGRVSNEDRYVSRVINQEVSNGQGQLLAVFDGHGGSATAQKLKENAEERFTENLVSNQGDVDAALRQTISDLQGLTINEESGSTGTIVYVTADMKKAYAAIVGDSPLIVKNAQGQIEDVKSHSTSDVDAILDLTNRGGEITEKGYIKFDGVKGPNMTRFFGNKEFTQVNRDADYYEFDLGEDSFVFLASDGVLTTMYVKVFEETVTMDYYPQEDIVSDIEAGKTANDIVRKAVAEESGDNVTALLLKPGDQAMEVERPIERLYLSPLTQGALKRSGITTVNQLVQYNERELLDLPQIGPEGVDQIKRRLRELGLSLKSPEDPRDADISELDMANRFKTTLRIRHGVTKVRELEGLTVEQIARFDGFGKPSAQTIYDAVQKHLGDAAMEVLNIPAIQAQIQDSLDRFHVATRKILSDQTALFTARPRQGAKDIRLSYKNVSMSVDVEEKSVTPINSSALPEGFDVLGVEDNYVMLLVGGEVVTISFTSPLELDNGDPIYFKRSNENVNLEMSLGNQAIKVSRSGPDQTGDYLDDAVEAAFYITPSENSLAISSAYFDGFEFPDGELYDLSGLGLFALYLEKVSQFLPKTASIRLVSVVEKNTLAVIAQKWEAMKGSGEWNDALGDLEVDIEDDKFFDEVLRSLNGDEERLNEFKAQLNSSISETILGRLLERLGYKNFELMTGLSGDTMIDIVARTDAAMEAKEFGQWIIGDTVRLIADGQEGVVESTLKREVDGNIVDTVMVRFDKHITRGSYPDKVQNFTAEEAANELEFVSATGVPEAEKVEFVPAADLEGKIKQVKEIRKRALAAATQKNLTLANQDFVEQRDFANQIFDSLGGSPYLSVKTEEQREQYIDLLLELAVTFPYLISDRDAMFEGDETDLARKAEDELANLLRPHPQGLLPDLSSDKNRIIYDKLRRYVKKLGPISTKRSRVGFPLVVHSFKNFDQLKGLIKSGHTSEFVFTTFQPNDSDKPIIVISKDTDDRSRMRLLGYSRHAGHTHPSKSLPIQESQTDNDMARVHADEKGQAHFILAYDTKADSLQMAYFSPETKVWDYVRDSSLAAQQTIKERLQGLGLIDQALEADLEPIVDKVYAGTFNEATIADLNMDNLIDLLKRLDLDDAVMDELSRASDDDESEMLNNEVSLFKSAQEVVATRIEELRRSRGSDQAIEAFNETDFEELATLTGISIGRARGNQYLTPMEAERAMAFMDDAMSDGEVLYTLMEARKRNIVLVMGKGSIEDFKVRREAINRLIKQVPIEVLNKAQDPILLDLSKTEDSVLGYVRETIAKQLPYMRRSDGTMVLKRKDWYRIADAIGATLPDAGQLDPSGEFDERAINEKFLTHVKDRSTPSTRKLFEAIVAAVTDYYNKEYLESVGLNGPQIVETRRILKEAFLLFSEPQDEDEDGERYEGLEYAANINKWLPYILIKLKGQLRESIELPLEEDDQRATPREDLRAAIMPTADVEALVAEYNRAFNAVAPRDPKTNRRNFSSISLRSNTAILEALKAINEILEAKKKGVYINLITERLEQYAGTLQLALNQKINVKNDIRLGPEDTADSKILSFIYTDPVRVQFGKVAHRLEQSEDGSFTLQELADNNTLVPGTLKKLDTITTVGRQRNNRLVVSDRTVSRKHAIIEVNSETGAVSIEDMGTQNLTRVRFDQAIEGEIPGADKRGGIDFTSENVDIKIKRDQDKPLIQFNTEDLKNLENMDIPGFVPIIINITPVTNIPLLLGEVEDIKDGDLSKL